MMATEEKKVRKTAVLRWRADALTELVQEIKEDAFFFRLRHVVSGPHLRVGLTLDRDRLAYGGRGLPLRVRLRRGLRLTFNREFDRVLVLALEARIFKVAASAGAVFVVNLVLLLTAL
jgi:hypothetical protein